MSEPKIQDPENDIEILPSQNNHDLKNELDEKQRKIEELQELIEKMKLDDAQKDNTVKMASEIMESLRIELDKASKEITRLEDENFKLNEEKTAIEKEVLENQQQLEKVLEESQHFDRLKKENNELKENIQKLKNEARIFSRQTAQKQFEFAKELEDLKTENQTLKEQKDESDRVIELKEREYQTILEKTQSLEDELAKAQNEIEQLKKKNENVDNNPIPELTVLKITTDESKKSSVPTSPKQVTWKDQIERSQTPKSPEIKIFNERTSYSSEKSPVQLLRSPSPEKKGIIPNIIASPERTVTSPSRIKSPIRLAPKEEINVKKKIEAIEENFTDENLADEKKRENLLVELHKAREERPKINAGFEYLKIVVGDVMDQQRNMVAYIEKIMLKEMDSVNKMSDEVLGKEVTIRPELERWIMRNEELEQRLFEAAEKAKIFVKLIVDYRVALEDNKKQRILETRLKNLHMQNLEAFIRHLQGELEKKDNMYTQLFSECKTNVLQLNEVHRQELLVLNQNNETLEKNIQTLAGQKEDSDKKYGEMKKSHDEMRLYTLYIEKSLGFESTESNKNTFDTPKETLQKKLELIEKRAKSLVELEKAYFELKKTYTQDKEKSAHRISYLEGRVEELIDEREKAITEGKKLRENNAKLEESLGAMKQTSEQLRTQFNSIESEKDKFSMEASYCKKDLEKAKESLLEKNQQIFTLKHELKKAQENQNSLTGDLEIKETLISELQRQIDSMPKESRGLNSSTVKSPTHISKQSASFKNISEEDPFKAPTFRPIITDENSNTKQQYQAMLEEYELVLDFIQKNLQVFPEYYYKMAKGYFISEKQIQGLKGSKVSSICYTIKKNLQDLALDVQQGNLGALNTNAQDVFYELDSLASSFMEKPTRLKEILDTLNNIKDLHSRKNKRTFESDDPINIVLVLLEDVVSNLHQNWLFTGCFFHETNQEIRASNKTGKNYLNTPRVSNANQVLTSLDNFTQHLEESILVLSRKIIDNDEPARRNKSLSMSYVKDKNANKDVLADFLLELESIVEGFAKYTARIEPKDKDKSLKISLLTEEPVSIYSALQDNLDKSEKTFIDNITKYFSQYKKSEKMKPSDTHEIIGNIFNLRVKQLGVEKLEEVFHNFKNAIRLLDVNWIFKDEKFPRNYKSVLAKSQEINRVIESILEMISSQLAKGSNAILFDKEYIDSVEDASALYEKIKSAYLVSQDNHESHLKRKHNIRNQLLDLMRENGGYKIVLNSLLSVILKYKSIACDFH